MLISNSITAPRLFAVLVTFSVTTFHSSGELLKRFNENDLVNTHLSIRIPRLSIEEESLPSKPICGNCGDVDIDGADVEHLVVDDIYIMMKCLCVCVSQKIITSSWESPVTT